MTLKHFKSFVVLISLVFAGILSVTIPQSASALSGWDAERIISDGNFTDSTSMSAAEIQNFLNKKNSVCLKSFKTLGLYDENNNGAGDEPYGKGQGIKVSAATLISQAARIYDINPMVILVTLQKEQGLITRTDCPSWRYNTALGYGCPDSEPCDTSAYGFTRQIDYGVWHFRGFFEDSYPVPTKLPGQEYIAYNPSASCGGKTITIRNRATAALYSYTPYQPNKAALEAPIGQTVHCGAYGNKNFYYYYSVWFGPPNRSADSLFVTCDDGSEYLVESTEVRKRLVPDSVKAAWGLTSSDFLDVGYGCDFPTFDAALSNVVRSRSSSVVYLVDNAKAYTVDSQQAANAWGLGNVSTATFPMVNGDTLLDNLPITRTLPRVAKSTNTARSDRYLIDGSKRYLISGTEAGDTTSLQLVTGYDEVASAVFSTDLLQTLPLSGSLNYSFDVGSDTYLLDHATVRKVSPPSVAVWKDLTDDSEPTLTSDVLSLFHISYIGDNFQRDSQYYRLVPNNLYDRTSSSAVARNWSAHAPFGITNLLTNKILSASTLRNVVVALENNNIRLISCNSTKYVVERGIRAKRAISDSSAAEWGFNSYYWFNNDPGCNYTTYAQPLNGDLIRSY